MSSDVTKQSAYISFVIDGISVVKQSAYIGLLPEVDGVTKQSAYLSFFPYAPNKRRRIPLIVN